MMAENEELKICQLAPDLKNIMIVAVIIAKQETRIFPGWKGVGPERCVWNFTIRDSPHDTMNVAAWGDVEIIKDMSKTVQLGDVVSISGARVSLRHGENQYKKFNPTVSSDLTLSLDQYQSKVESCTDPEVRAAMSDLMHVPTKPTTAFVTLSDVERRSTHQIGPVKDVVDLLVAVLKVEPTRSIKKQNGSVSLVKDILLMDYTVNGLPMTLWNPDWIKRADHWKPGKTILFLADASIDMNAYKKRMVVGVGKQTVITEDPVSQEADTLRLFFQDAPLQLVDQLDQITANITNPKSINTVMTISQVKEILKQNNNSMSNDFYALLFCVPIALDLDGCTSVLATRCLECRTLIDERVGVCEQCDLDGINGMCSSTFSMKVTLADHTGSLNGIVLSGATAEKVLGITANDFKMLPDSEKTHLKWMFLLERCAVRIVILLPALSKQRNPLVSIVDCERADPREAAARYPVAR